MSTISRTTPAPPWADTNGDPYGRAEELAELGAALLQFYETGEIENPCDGPCDADDVVPQSRRLG